MRRSLERYLLIFSLFAASCNLYAQPDTTKIYQGFSGGMMLHTGYLFGQDARAPRDAQGTLCSPQGATFGIGGAIRVHLLNHLRIGTEGFVSTMNSTATDCRQLLQKGSYIRMGWGGALADACWRFDKVWPYIGASIGGGAMRSFYLLEGDQSDWNEETRTLFNKQSFFYVCPYVGLDWCMTPKVHMTFRADWVVGMHNKDIVLPTGPRLYVGFMFCH